MSKRTVWAVSASEYSDNQLVAIYETQEEAEATVVRIRFGSVYPIDLFSSGDTSLRALPYWTGWCKLSEDGRVLDEKYTHTHATTDESFTPKDPIDIHTREGWTVGGVHARTQGEARRITQEKVTQLVTRLRNNPIRPD